MGEFIGSISSNLISEAIFAFIAFIVAYQAYRLLYLRPWGEKFDDSLYYYLILVWTIEYRLGKICSPMSMSVPEELSRQIRKLEGDVESALIANDHLTKAIDLPLRPRKIDKALVSFHTTSAGLYSELHRALRFAGSEKKYLSYLRGGHSPVVGGNQATMTHIHPDQYLLKTLLKNHQESITVLANKVSTKGDPKFKFNPREHWKDWQPWEPPLSPVPGSRNPQ